MFLDNDDNKVSDYVSHFRQLLGKSYLNEKIVLTKDNKKVHLIHSSFYNDNSSTIGVIHFVGLDGHIGKLFYYLNFEENNTILHIADIQFNNQFKKKYISKGIGSAALYYLEDIAEKNNVSIITGKLFESDLKNNRELLFHFYNKNGFSIAKDEISKSLCLV